jgi:hypothetical protein
MRKIMYGLPHTGFGAILTTLTALGSIGAGWALRKVGRR